MKMKELFESRYYEKMITNPDHKPKKIAATIKKMLGKVGKIEFVKAEATLPRGWDYGFYAVVKAVFPSGKDVQAAITINIADNEVSGNISMDHPYGVVAMSRRDTLEKVLRDMIPEYKQKLESAAKA